MAHRYCLNCGQPLAIGFVEGRERAHCPACGFILYHNPAPVAMAVVEYEGKFLLVHRTIPPLQQYWAPPAGHVELGESVPQAAVREAKEETGVDVELGELIGVYSHPEVRVVLIVYRARAVGGRPQAGDDAGDVGLFERMPDQPPPDPAAATPTDLWFYQFLQTLKELP
ncbi:MAG: NUDIX hydrolase [Caldilineales bacterium]|nr:NUDIX hydrolase [Caldilineales bacterium]